MRDAARWLRIATGSTHRRIVQVTATMALVALVSIGVARAHEVQPSVADVEVTAEMGLQVWGVVKYVLHGLRGRS